MSLRKLRGPEKQAVSRSHSGQAHASARKKAKRVANHFRLASLASASGLSITKIRQAEQHAVNEVIASLRVPAYRPQERSVTYTSRFTW